MGYLDWKYTYGVDEINNNVEFYDIPYAIIKGSTVVCLKGEQLILVKDEYREMTEQEVTDKLIADGREADDIEVYDLSSPLRFYTRAKQFEDYLNRNKDNTEYFNLELDVDADEDGVSIELKDDNQLIDIAERLIKLGFSTVEVDEIVEEYKDSVQ